MRTPALLLVLALGCAPVSDEPAPELSVSKAQFWGGWSGGGGGGGASTSSTNTWTAAQSFDVTDSNPAVRIDQGDYLCLSTAECDLSRISATASALSLSADRLTINNFDIIAVRNLYPQAGLQIGNGGTQISDSYAASSSIDFAGVTDGCEDSGNITVTGAAVNDTCEVGPPATLPSTNSWVQCRVTATNTVVVRHCAHGASGNPASATYTVRVFDP